MQYSLFHSTRQKLVQYRFALQLLRGVFNNMYDKLIPGSCFQGRSRSLTVLSIILSIFVYFKLFLTIFLYFTILNKNIIETVISTRSKLSHTFIQSKTNLEKARLRIPGLENAVATLSILAYFSLVLHTVSPSHSYLIC